MLRCMRSGDGREEAGSMTPEAVTRHGEGRFGTAAQSAPRAPHGWCPS